MSTKKSRRKTRQLQNKSVRQQYQRPKVAARTDNQQKYINAMWDSEITICKGPAGTGKTRLAIGTAIHFLDQQLVKKIVIARPVVESGENIGHLPGSADDKLDPYVRPIFDELSYFANQSEIQTLRNSKTLEIVPIGFMRGRTFRDSFIIVDECQNAKYEQLKMIITRFGEGSRLVLTGDVTQSDLELRHQGGFAYTYHLFEKIREISCIQLESIDIVRHSLVGKMIELWEKNIDMYKMNGTIPE